MEETTKNNDRKKYVLQVQRGEELNLHRLEEISNKQSIMRPSYEKAMRALMQIMRRTKRFHKDNDKKCGSSDVYALENRLFSYSGNIIAFAAPRGGGKTATMLSFSKILKEGFEKRRVDYCNAPGFEYAVDNSFLNDIGCGKEEQPERWMERCCFIPLTPIAPAVLEGKQNILYVVLSRLYRYAERLITEHSRLDRIKEAQKNQIIRSFQKALSGINGIKHPEEHPGDLAGMQDVCDGLSLSRHFYDLVQNILQLAAGERDISDRYLVIQLDDADSKMQRVYEVMEDVRKYLMIPNLVILMSVDQKCLSDVVFQDNLRCFPDLIKFDRVRLSRDLSKITNKYIDKLIPPTHMIQLPLIDQVVIHWGDMLRLRYVDETGKNIYRWMNDEELDLQTSILMLIYRKTGILFIKPPHYLHNIIPRTLRGFVQLLALLDSMPDIPMLDFKRYSNVKDYAVNVLKQSEIAALNQRRFADYFKNSWINVKITDLKDLDFLRKLADTVSANRIPLTVKHLRERYEVGAKNNRENVGAKDKRGNGDIIHIPSEPIKTRIDLDRMMGMLGKAYRTEADFRLIFAIQTLFTMDSHQHILKRKREAAREFLRKADTKNVLVFDFDTEHIHVPRGLRIDGALGGHIDLQSKVRKCRYLFTPLLDISDFKQAIPEMLYRANDIIGLQQAIHQAQEIAVTLYSNSDAVNAVRDHLKEYMVPIDIRINLDEFVPAIATELISAILKQLSNINDGKLLTCSMDYLSDLVAKKENGWLFDIFEILVRIAAKGKISEDNVTLWQDFVEVDLGQMDTEEIIQPLKFEGDDDWPIKESQEP